MASSQNVKNFLSAAISRVESRLKVSQKAPVKAVAVTKNIRNYGWEQNKSSVKFYITLEEVINEDQIEVTLSKNSLCLVANGQKARHELKINQLYAPIDSSNYKIKKTDGEWDSVSAADSKPKTKTPKMDTDMDKSDPSAGLMQMMQKLYDEGDDDMKRTITKAWSESQEKQRQNLAI